jgi:hypothetical protein
MFEGVTAQEYEHQMPGACKMQKCVRAGSERQAVRRADQADRVRQDSSPTEQIYRRRIQLTSSTKHFTPSNSTKIHLEV